MRGKVIPQLLTIFGNQTEGHSFEELVLGPPVEYGGTQERTHFERAVIRSLGVQPPGYPWGKSGYQIDHIFKEVSEFFSDIDRKYLHVFSTLGTPLDLWHHTDCLFLWRTSIVSVDLTLEPEKKKFNPHTSHLLFTQDMLGDTVLLDEFCKKVAQELQKNEDRLSFASWKEMQRRINTVYLR